MEFLESNFREQDNCAKKILFLAEQKVSFYQYDSQVDIE
jgi:hypothetical protein